jgi:hypothetical protein
MNLLHCKREQLLKRLTFLRGEDETETPATGTGGLLLQNQQQGEDFGHATKSGGDNGGKHMQQQQQQQQQQCLYQPHQQMIKNLMDSDYQAWARARGNDCCVSFCLLFHWPPFAVVFFSFFFKSSFVVILNH